MPRAISEKRRFALDQNFPVSVVSAFAPLMPHVELVSIASIDPALAEVADWELFAAVHRDRTRWDGLITNDSDCGCAGHSVQARPNGPELSRKRGEGHETEHHGRKHPCTPKGTT